MTTSRTSDPPDQQPGTPGLRHGVAPRVFIPAAAIILLFVIITVVVPNETDAGDPAGLYKVMLDVQTWIVEWLGSYYVLVVTAFVAFALWVGLGHYGDIKLGKDDDKPEFSLFSWFTMLFAAGMGIGLVFWGVAEPLNHYAGVPNRASGIEGSEAELAQGSLTQTFLHWGLHPWAIYVVIGLAIAYAVHRKGRPISIRWTLRPLFGDRINGWFGDIIDIISIIGTLFGVATSLGLGVLQIGAGLSFLDIVEADGDGNLSNLVYVVLIGAITLLAIVSVVTGVKKGIKWLSNINMSLAGVLLLIVILAGPTLFIFREFVQSVGEYFQNFLQKSFDTTAHEADAGTAWQGWWTMFYWGWWISWAPFVGVFIARISKGRTIRQFVAAVLLVPTTLTFVWFTALGGTAINHEQENPGSLVDGGAVDTEGSLFQLLDTFGGAGTALVVGAIILIVLFFVTSSDSGSLVVDMLASGGDPEPPTWSRVFWAAAEGLVAIALLTAGGESGLNALKYAAIIIALPFSVVMILMAIASLKEFRQERQALLRIQRRQQREELTQHLIEEGYVEPNGEGGDTTTRS